MLRWAALDLQWVCQAGSQKEADPGGLFSVGHQAPVGVNLVKVEFLQLNLLSRYAHTHTHRHTHTGETSFSL